MLPTNRAFQAERRAHLTKGSGIGLTTRRETSPRLIKPPSHRETQSRDISATRSHPRPENEAVSSSHPCRPKTINATPATNPCKCPARTTREGGPSRARAHS